MQKTPPTPIITIEEHPEGLQILRDGEEILTPKRSPLVLPNAALADAVAEEFASGAAKRPLAQIAYAVIDLAMHERDMLTEAMLAYLHTDSICYFAEAPELKQRERKHWQPIIDWAAERFDCEFLTFEGVMPADQPDETVTTAKTYMDTLDPWRIGCLLEFTRGFGSFILALAVVEGRVNTETAFDCSQVDEDMQREQWGEEDEAMERREKLKTEMLAAERFLGMI